MTREQEIARIEEVRSAITPRSGVDFHVEIEDEFSSSKYVLITVWHRRMSEGHVEVREETNDRAVETAQVIIDAFAAWLKAPRGKE